MLYQILLYQLSIIVIIYNESSSPVVLCCSLLLSCASCHVMSCDVMCRASSICCALPWWRMLCYALCAGEWLRDQQVMEDTMVVMMQEGWMG